MKKLISVLLGVILASGALFAMAPPASATDGNIKADTPTCVDGVWGVVLQWNSTNVPSNVWAEVKAISTTAGTLSVSPGHGVMSGNQVILAAFPEHVNNWPGVKTHKGNWSDKFSVTGIPASVSSITVMVQYDYSNSHSDDPTKTINKPDNCNTPPPPYDECKDLPGNQPKDSQCSPLSKSRERTTEGTPDCKAGTVPVNHQSQSVTQTYSNGVWTYPEWPITWNTDSTSTRPTTAEECPPVVVPPPPPTHVYDNGVEYQDKTIKTGGTCRVKQITLTSKERKRTWTSVDGVKTYSAWSTWKTETVVHPRTKALDCIKHLTPWVRVIDLCSCKSDKIIVHGKGIAFKSIRQNKNVFVVRLIARPGSDLPVNYRNPGGARATHVKWVFKTTNTKCACPPKKKCAPRKPPPPSYCPGRCS
jgi:hypothetical protein